MEGLWTSTDQKSDQIILITDKAVCKGQARKESFNSLVNRIHNGEIPDSLFCIPFDYILRFESAPNSGEIRIIMKGKSEDELKINQEHVRNEIVNFLMNKVPNITYSKQLPRFIGHIKGPLMALLVVIAFFLWTMFFVMQIHNGVEYIITGASIGGLAYGLASLGLSNVLIIFGALLILSILALRKRIRSRVEIESLTFEPDLK